jgi:O-antigen/teichoic acid export membrane protein
LLLAALFTPAAAGFYALARSVINLPLNIVGLAIGNVLYARFAELQRERKPLLPLTVQATLFQLFVPGAGIGFVALIFPDLFSLVFGVDWRASGEFAQWMTPWMVCMLANIPSVRALPVIRQQKWHLLLNGMIFLAGIVGLYLGYSVEGTAIGSIIYFSVASTIVYIAQFITYATLIYLYDKKMNHHDRKS